MENPKISIVIPTYNRSKIVHRSIDSILNQSFQDFEIILVNNGSTDDTDEVLSEYKKHEKIRYFHLKENRRAAGGINYGFSQIQGEWFTNLPDKAELFPYTFEVFMEVAEKMPEVDAITGNCMEVGTGKMTGRGLHKDQYLDIDTIINTCRGEFFGVTKTKLLGDKKLNENLVGFERTFYYQIDAIANRYYIHKPMRKVFTGKDPRYRAPITHQIHERDADQKINLYKGLLEEDFYWDCIKKYRPQEYKWRTFAGWIFQRINKDKAAENAYLQKIQDYKGFNEYKLLQQIMKFVSNDFSKMLYEKGFAFLDIISLKKHTT